MAIDAVQSLFDWFHATLEPVATAAEPGFSPATVDYLANVLNDHAARRDATLDAHDSLVLALDAALVTRADAQAVHLQRIGDRALCTLSLFPEQLRHLAIAPDLYVEVGTFAYSRAARLAPVAGDAEVEALRELGGRFVEVVDVVATAATAGALGAVTRDLVRVFDRGRKTKKPAGEGGPTRS